MKRRGRARHAVRKSRSNGRRFAGVAAVATLLIVGFNALNAASQPVSSGSVGNFEDDGNMVTDGDSPAIDWDNPSGHLTTVVDDTNDSGYQGSSKEEEPAGWSCNDGGANPGKGNILRAYVNTRLLSATSAYVDLAWVRQDGNGDANVDFEFNKQAITNQCPYETRTDGDLLIRYDFGGQTNAVNITTYKWDHTAPNGHPWVQEADLPSGAIAGATNADTITDSIFGGDVGSREFGEATLDLKAFNDATGGGVLGCPGFGQVNIRTRSAEDLNSALQDRMPATSLDLSSCGSVTLQKNDNAGNPLAGAEFGLFDPSDTTFSNPLFTCTSDSDGTCTFDSVAPDDYKVKEISAPQGYDRDTHSRDVHVGFREHVDLTDAPFVDNAHTGFVHIDKVLHDVGGNTVTPSDPNVLNGTTFALYKDKNHNNAMDSGEQSTLWPSGNPATCAIAGGTSGCDIGPVVTGDYRVAETVLPSNSMSAGDVDVTVHEGNAGSAVHVDFVNVLAPINISLDKSVPDTAKLGDTITYTFAVTTTGPRLHGIAVDDNTGICNSAPVFDPNSDTNGNGFLEVGETWTYTCPHVLTDADPDPLVNTATVAGTDDYGRGVSAQDSATIGGFKVLPEELARTGGFPFATWTVIGIAFLGFGILSMSTSVSIFAIAEVLPKRSRRRIALPTAKHPSAPLRKHAWHMRHR